MSKAIAPATIEECVRDERWNRCWLLRPVMRFGKMVWQVWLWDYEKRELWAVTDDCDSQLAAAQAALAKGTP